VLPWLAAAGVLGFTLTQAWHLRGPASAEAGSRGAALAVDKGPLEIKLHGSTPTLAWSPDSARVAVASAFEYYGFSQRARRYRAHTGIYVVDPQRRTHRKVSKGQGYHPLWLDKRTVAWGHSPYELGTAGLYVARLSKRGARVRRVGTFKGVYHTRRANKGRAVVMYSGFPEYKRWVRVSLKTGTFTAVPGAARNSWNAPAKAVRSQCRQKVGAVRARITAGGRYLVETASQNVPVPGKAYQFYNYNRGGGRSSCSRKGHCGPVKPCLSPNGRWLAYVTPAGPAGRFALRVMRIPK
jgi:hypothetical protein